MEKIVSDSRYQVRPVFRILAGILGFLFLIFPVLAFVEGGFHEFFKGGHNSHFLIASLVFGQIFVSVAIRGKYWQKC